ncbi:MAG: glycosyltransferase [Bryobacterales bacterium]|nr:glycosyltransferase [Bryobacterales bacterium]
MRSAIIHYWLLNMRGGEKVVEALCRLLPDADIFTLFFDPDNVSETIRRHRVKASFLQPFRKAYRSLLPMMPMALESFDLRGYDLIVSSESGPAKGVVTSSNSRHVCYCHTPMRYLWDMYAGYRGDWTDAGWKRALMTPLTNYLRLWDFASAARVDKFVANSDNVRKRIWKTYRRGSQVVCPPVDVDTFYWKPPQDYYLIVSELVPYKRLDAAVRAFNQNGRKLLIAGDGPNYKSLKKSAARNIEFCGRVPDAELRELYARCRAFVMPGEEDFGITAVEALASGKPVIALARGGALEIVPEFGGLLYDEIEDLYQAVERWDKFENALEPRALQCYAAQFSETEFARQMMPILRETNLPVSPRVPPCRPGGAPVLHLQDARVGARAPAFSGTRYSPRR